MEKLIPSQGPLADADDPNARFVPIADIRALQGVRRNIDQDQMQALKKTFHYLGHMVVLRE